jgi:hypothetical protein
MSTNSCNFQKLAKELVHGWSNLVDLSLSATKPARRSSIDTRLRNSGHVPIGLSSSLTRYLEPSMVVAICWAWDGGTHGARVEKVGGTRQRANTVEEQEVENNNRNKTLRSIRGGIKPYIPCLRSHVGNTMVGQTIIQPDGHATDRVGPWSWRMDD